MEFQFFQGFAGKNFDEINLLHQSPMKVNEPCELLEIDVGYSIANYFPVEQAVSGNIKIAIINIVPIILSLHILIYAIVMNLCVEILVLNYIKYCRNRAMASRQGMDKDPIRIPVRARTRFVDLPMLVRVSGPEKGGYRGGIRSGRRRMAAVEPLLPGKGRGPARKDDRTAPNGVFLHLAHGLGHGAAAERIGAMGEIDPWRANGLAQAARAKRQRKAPFRCARMAFKDPSTCPEIAPAQ